MLQRTPESERETTTREAADDALYCAGCGHLVTRTRWAISIDGHEHVVFNPAGRLFRVRCFSDAPGVAATGTPSGYFTWFRGYDWCFALCRGCSDHLGWSYTGDGPPARFFGLIASKLVGRPSTGGEGGGGDQGGG